ncbi:MAG: magnesium transporter [Phycisphaeraceae bacterium]|nr:MAG: magnesium transporter [Phycisphaeraceae bacterium]
MLLIPEILEQHREAMKKALEENRPSDAALSAQHLSSNRVARVLREAPRETFEPFLKSIDPARAGRVLGHLPPGLVCDLLAEMDQDTASQFFRSIPPNQAADILEILNEEQRDRLFSESDAALRKSLEELGGYPHGSAGSAMSPHFIAIEKGRSVGETLKAVLSAPPQLEKSSYVYVINAERKILGVLSVKDLMRGDPQLPVEKAMNPTVIAVRSEDPAPQAARLIRNRRFTMLPVVNDKDAILGVITFDDAMDILAEEVADQFAHMGAVGTEESFFTPPASAVKMRLPWMIANVFLNLGAVMIITGFEDTIAAVAILAAFLPMITDMGGNVGIQSLSVAIRSIALGEVRIRDFWRAIRKEVTVGLINGAVLGTLFAVIAFFLQGNMLIGLLAGVALGVNVLVAGLVGGTIPFLIKRIGKDPAMMTGPILTTITDITGVSIYLGLCTLFLTDLLN